ncbi:MAG: cytochrome c maturation protein CcmE [Acidimicrobiales bacterium]
MSAVPPGRRGPTGRRLLVVGTVIVVAIGFLVFKGLTSAVVFFKTASEAVSQRASLGNADFQLEGVVVGGSVHRAGPTEVAFVISQGGATIHVLNSGNPPEMFRPGLPVVVVGHFVGSSDRFSSDQVMVKHSQQYIAAHPDRVKAPSGSNS